MSSDESVIPWGGGWVGRGERNRKSKWRPSSYVGRIQTPNEWQTVRHNPRIEENGEINFKEIQI